MDVHSNKPTFQTNKLDLNDQQTCSLSQSQNETDQLFHKKSIYWRVPVRVILRQKITKAHKCIHESSRAKTMRHAISQLFASISVFFINCNFFALLINGHNQIRPISNSSVNPSTPQHCRTRRCEFRRVFRPVSRVGFRTLFERGVARWPLGWC